jgi:hypothetical protein
MAIGDTNAIIRAYLVTQTALTNLIGGASPRIYCPKLPQGITLPAISFLTGGGQNKPEVPYVVSPSVQFSCWDDDPIGARQVYRALYDAWNLLLNQSVTVGAATYKIFYTQEEMQGIDMQDPDILNYYRVLCWFRITIKVI